MDVAIGIAASANTEGTTRTHGVPGTAGIVSGASTPVNRALIIWGIAVGLLFLFHVGGAKLG